MEHNLGASLLLDSDGRIVDAAGACEQLLGHSADSLKETTLPELAVERERKGIEKVFDRLRTESTIEFALIPAHAVPPVRSHWRASRQPNGTIMASGVDPGERVTQVTAILDMVDALPMLVAYVDRDYCYRFNNSAYERMFGVPRMALFGKAVSEVIDAQSWIEIEPHMRRALAGDQPRFAEKVRLRDGRQIQVQTEYIPDRSREGEVRGFYAVINDVTEYADALEMMRAVHDTINQVRVDYDTTIRDLLRVGREFLALDIGIVSDTRDGAYTIRFVDPVNANLAAGDRFSIGETYCNLTLRAGDVVSVAEASKDASVHRHPCYRRFALEAYLGVPLANRGTVIGTLNFSAAEARGRPFSRLELELVRLLGSAIERLLIQDEFEKGLYRSRLEMERRALTDSLTGLPNRAHVFSEFERLAAYRNTNDTALSIALLDVDHFKRINDTYGHQAGDEALIGMTQAIRAALRQSDLIGRVGGEEFLILLPDSNLEAAADVLERVRNAIEGVEVRSRDGRRIAVTASIGVAEFTPGLDVDAIYAQADRALYGAKSSGRNRVELFESA